MAAAISFETPIGTIGVEATDAGVCRVRLPDARGRRPAETSRDDGGEAAAHAARAAQQVEEYLRGGRDAFELVLDWEGIDVTHRRVLETLRELAPYGTTVTYGELGRRAEVDDPRDVGVLMARNPLPLIVPCHRVLASDGLGGYGGGLELKQRLLEIEGALPARLDLGV